MSMQGPESIGKRTYFPETQAIIDRLLEDPTAAFDCIHGDGPAVEIAEVPQGCVAFPGVETQALCPQHILTDGSFEGIYPVVDLTIDAVWSRAMDAQPDYCITGNAGTGQLKLIPFSEFNMVVSES